MKLGALLKWGILIKGVAFEQISEEVCSAMFLQWIGKAESSYKHLMKSPKKSFITSVAE
jgi:hypothetical protein